MECAEAMQIARFVSLRSMPRRFGHLGLSPGGTAVVGQGRKPLEPVPLRFKAPEGRKNFRPYLT